MTTKVPNNVAEAPILMAQRVPTCRRFGFGTEAVRGSAKLHGLKEMMGHSSIATTGMYLHADEDELEQVAAVMPRVLGGSGES